VEYGITYIYTKIRKLVKKMLINITYRIFITEISI